MGIWGKKTRWKSRWGKPLLRSAMKFAGGTALAACAALLGIAVFTEPATVETGGMWLAVGMIIGCIAVGIVLTIMVTHPGWTTGLAGGILAVGSAIGGWLVYSVMPDPGLEAYIAHRYALAAFAFGFGVVGGGLLVLGEMVTDGKPTPPAWRPPQSVIFRVNVLTVAAVVGLAALGTPAMHDWADNANTDASQASGAPPKPDGQLKLDEVGDVATGMGGYGTPYGLLTLDDKGDNASVAVSMKDAQTGEDRWHHHRWNRASTGKPVLSSDGKLVALPGERRDNSRMRFVTVLDTETGKVRADALMNTDPGVLHSITDSRLLFVSPRTSHNMTARDFDGHQKWEFKAPSECQVSTVADDGSRAVAGLACRSEITTKEYSQVVSLSADSGKHEWAWKSEAEGNIYAHGLTLTPDLVVVDVRRDESSNDSLFAARKYRHDVSAIALDSGESQWRRAKLDLGDTYAPACAGMLRIAGEEREKGRVLLAECHQINGESGGSFDITALSLEHGKTSYKMKAPLGYAPKREDDTSGWFAGLPDGRAVIAADASLDLNNPKCQMYVSGPQRWDDRKETPMPDDIPNPEWCRKSGLHLTPGGLVASFPGQGERPGNYFTVN